MIAAVDVAILAAFVVYCLVTGLRARRAASRDLAEYFLAGRSLPGWKAGLSMAATQFAADTPLLVTGLIATGGVFSLWRLWIYALAFLFMGLVLGGAWRRARVLTDAELAELRYHGSRLAVVLRGVKAVYFGLIFNCAVMAMVLFAATRIAEPFLRWHEWLPPGAFRPVVAFVDWAGLVLTTSADPAFASTASANNLLSILAIVLVTALYSTTGGLRAVVNTDVAQLAIMLLATLAYAIVVVRQAGGLAAIPDRLSAAYGDGFAREALAFTPGQARDAGAVVLGTIAIQWIAQMNADGTGYLAQRTMACRSDRDARDAALIFVVTQILVRSLLWIPIGLALLALFPGAPGDAAAREMTYVDGIARWLPVGVRGLMLTGMLAALASTVDTHLNWGASYVTNDLYHRIYCRAWRKRVPGGRELVWVARLSSLVILAISLVVLSRLRSIEAAWKTCLLLGAGMGAPLVLRWLWWRVTAASELAAILASAALAPILLAHVEQEGARMLVMTVVTTGVAVGVALATSRPSAGVVEFYRRVRPPGFWGPIAALCGDDPRAPRRELAGGLTLTAAAAFAVFCALVGAGTWLVRGTPPAWFPWRGPWITLLLLAGAATLAWVARRFRARRG